ncbi:MAG: histidinol-phosphate transaminase [Planctomycetaceae bacterium]|nr:histidinol-phosphate transaminase [Planctomycetaceae bacterium]
MSLASLARRDLWDECNYQPQGADQTASLRLNCNENPWPPENATDPLIHRYPEKQPAALVERLAELYGVGSEELLITRGADDGIDALIRSFCVPARDAIAQCSPAFVMYQFFARLQSVKTIDVPLDAAQGFAVPFAKLLELEDAKLYFLCTPNNPTGSGVNSQRIVEFANQVAERALVVVDEAYIEFAETGSLCRQATQVPNLAVLRTLSKAWSLAGARLGAVVGGRDLIAYLKATTSPYPLSRASVDAALRAMDQSNVAIAEQRIATLCEQREDFAKILPVFDFVEKVYPSEANFLLVKVRDAKTLMQYCKNAGVLLRDQSAQPGLEQHVRISIGTAADMQRLAQVLASYEKGTK